MSGDSKINKESKINKAKTGRFIVVHSVVVQPKDLESTGSKPEEKQKKSENGKH